MTVPFTYVWAYQSDQVREPLDAEISGGFSCNPDRALFNYLFQRHEQAINGLSIRLDEVVFPPSFVPVKAILISPPGNPLDGDRYAIDKSATGAWNGYDGGVATFDQSQNQWVIEPATYQRAVGDQNTETLKWWTPDGWKLVFSPADIDFASDQETIDGTRQDVAVNPKGWAAAFGAKIASKWADYQNRAAGKLVTTDGLATAAMITARSGFGLATVNDVIALSPSIPETQFASDAETIAGELTTKAVTPKGLVAFLTSRLAAKWGDYQNRAAGKLVTTDGLAAPSQITSRSGLGVTTVNDVVALIGQTSFNVVGPGVINITNLPADAYLQFDVSSSGGAGYTVKGSRNNGVSYDRTLFTDNLNSGAVGSDLDVFAVYTGSTTTPPFHIPYNSGGGAPNPPPAGAAALGFNINYAVSWPGNGVMNAVRIETTGSFRVQITVRSRP